MCDCVRVCVRACEWYVSVCVCACEWYVCVRVRACVNASTYIYHKYERVMQRHNTFSLCCAMVGVTNRSVAPSVTPNTTQ